MPDILSLSGLLAAAAGAIALLMLATWVASLVQRDASLVDRVWGPGYALVAALGLVLGSGAAPRRILLFVLAGIWGLRLGLHLTRRNWGEGEDRRYRRMREHWGADRFPWISLVTVFLLQGALMWLIALPLTVGASSPTPARLTWADALGAALWLVGLLFEAIGDEQLRRFKADPDNEGEVMDRGLWRYSRHPNYFGDAMVWIGIFTVASHTEHGWWTIVSPLLMIFFLTRVSGVPMLERHLHRTRPGYAEYARRTSAFVPWPPRES